MFKRTPKAPWKKFYTKDEREVEVPDISLYKYIKEVKLWVMTRIKLVLIIQVEMASKIDGDLF